MNKESKNNLEMVGPPRLELGTYRFWYSKTFILAWTISSPSIISASDLTGGVLDASDVLHNKFVLLHLVSEPSSDASEAWLLIGMFLFKK